MKTGRISYGFQGETLEKSVLNSFLITCYYITVDCQGEPVEPGIIERTRLRQAQADITIV